MALRALRRLLRRAVRFSQTLGINEPFMYKLVDIVADIMEPYYPNVKEKSDFIKRVIKSEEERFHETLQEGVSILNQLITQEKNLHIRLMVQMRLNYMIRMDSQLS